MKFATQYVGNRRCGNSEDGKNYLVTVQRNDLRKTIDIEMIFDRPAAGRGVGEFQGRVQSLYISLPGESCRVIGQLLAAASSPVVTGKLELRINEAQDAERKSA